MPADIHNIVQADELKFADLQHWKGWQPESKSSTVYDASCTL